ncbi:MAG: hypothetical protein J5990_08150, partial [Bacteroidales bacterium]|nr:hypothetical protein [Bacteroidales bacterium]
MPPLHIKARARLLSDKLSEDLPYGHKESDSCLSTSVPLTLNSYIKSRILSSMISLPSARIYKGKAVWRLSPFSSGKSCELRDFAYGENLYVLMQDFPPP